LTTLGKKKLDLKRKKKLKCIDQSFKNKVYDGKNFKKTLKRMGKKDYNGTPKPNSMGCCQKEGHKVGLQKFWRENKFEFVYYTCIKLWM
jgi:hypothetical protein